MPGGGGGGGERGGGVAAAPPPAEGMRAYVKGSDPGGLAMAVDGGKGGRAKKTCTPAAPRTAGNPSQSGAAAEVAGRTAAPKMSRGQRAQLLAAGDLGSILAPGRLLCEWVGNGERYKLVGNCLDCGKILCDQEGVGPCLVCGSEHVYLSDQGAMLDGTRLDQATLADRRRGRMSGASDAHDALLQPSGEARNAAEDAAFLKALDLRDRLIHFEAHRAERTTVIDDEADYFDSNAQWLTEEQRAAARAAETAFHQRLNRRRTDDKIVVAIDFAGRKIYEAEPPSAALSDAAAGSRGPVDASPDDWARETHSGGRRDLDDQGDGPANLLRRTDGQTAPGRGPLFDLMGPSLHADMSLGLPLSPSLSLSLSLSLPAPVCFSVVCVLTACAIQLQFDAMACIWDMDGI